MQRGYMGTGMLLTRKAELFCLGTGSDATAEHEMGSAELIAALCGGSEATKEQIAAQLKAGQLKSYPELKELRRIKRRLDEVQFEERGSGDDSVAVLSFRADGQAVDPFDGYMASQLRVSDHDRGIAGAWCSSAFAFKVVGEKRCGQLRGFASALRAGRCAFAGALLNGLPELPGGVVIAALDLLRPEHSALIQSAQSKFEGDVRLFAQSRLNELHALERKHLPLGGVGYLWPVWKDSIVDGEVVYALNPSSNVKARYYGPYTFDELEAWIKQGARAPLGDSISA